MILPVFSTSLLIGVIAIVLFILATLLWYKLREQNQKKDPDTTNLASQENNPLPEGMQKTSDEYLQEYQTHLKQLETQYTLQFETMMQQSGTTISATLDKFQQMLSVSLQDLQKKMEEKMQEEYAQATVAIHEYKKHQVEKARQDITAMLTNVSKEVLGKAISFNDHQQFIIDALEKAKQEGMFDA